MANAYGGMELSAYYGYPARYRSHSASSFFPIFRPSKNLILAKNAGQQQRLRQLRVSTVGGKRSRSGPHCPATMGSAPPFAEPPSTLFCTPELRLSLVKAEGPGQSSRRAAKSKSILTLRFRATKNRFVRPLEVQELCRRRDGPGELTPVFAMTPHPTKPGSPRTGETNESSWLESSSKA